MIEIKCDGCNRIVQVPDDWDTSATCNECGSYFNEVDDEDEEEDEEEITSDCAECGKEFNEDDLIYFEESDILLCKKCIDKKYPRKVETKTIYEEKIVEKPVIKYVDNKGNEIRPSFIDKSRFD